MKTVKTVLIISILLNSVFVLGAIYFVIFRFNPTTSNSNSTYTIDSEVEIQEDGSTRDFVEKYIVKPGDTLTSIADDWGITVDTIKSANNLRLEEVRPGQTLEIPTSDGIFVTVQEGDTLESLAREYSADDQAIADFNCLDYPFTLEEGEILFIPDGRMPTSELELLNNCEDYSKECNFEDFEYTVIGSPVEFQPDAKKYTGYRVCDDEISSCTVYAIETGFGGQPTSDGKYKVGFNTFQCPSAAAGTKYCIVEGPILIEVYSDTR
jgi:LysM repeat protein